MQLSQRAGESGAGEHESAAALAGAPCDCQSTCVEPALPSILRALNLLSLLHSSTTCVLGAMQVKDTATGKTSVQAICEDGQVFEGDMLIGADGIWSKVRSTSAAQCRQGRAWLQLLLGPGRTLYLGCQGRAHE